MNPISKLEVPKSILRNYNPGDLVNFSAAEISDDGKQYVVHFRGGKADTWNATNVVEVPGLGKVQMYQKRG